MQFGDARYGGGGHEEKSRYLKAISHPRRRRVLDVLQIERRSLGLHELTHAILDLTGSTGPGEAEEVRISLYHQHLPHLDEAGLIEFDEQDNVVEITEKALGKLR